MKFKKTKMKYFVYDEETETIHKIYYQEARASQALDILTDKHQDKHFIMIGHTLEDEAHPKLNMLMDKLQVGDCIAAFAQAVDFPDLYEAHPERF